MPVSEKILELLESDIDDDKCAGVALFLIECELVGTSFDNEIKKIVL